MRIVASVALFAGLALAGSPAKATFCSTDTVPAATLLLPYFEVDLDDPNGVTTLFSINNARATAGLAHVTLWTDWAIPTLDFDIYLTGYDVQTFNLRDLFNGNVPRTADPGRDPADTISPHGFLSEDEDFPNCGNVFPYSKPALSELLRTHLRASHLGGRSPVYNRCVGSVPATSPSVVRGYVTIDAVKSCSFQLPNEPSYLTEVASRENRLWGTVIYVDPANNSAQQESLVHIEACDPADVSQSCPTGAGSYTFYGRYVGFDGSDDREPLASVFAASYLNGGTFSGGTSLIVWRDTKVDVTEPYGTDCSEPEQPSWYPLGERSIRAFDEQENPFDICPVALPTSPPSFQRNCLPLATQKTLVGGADLPVVHSFGWLELDLDFATITDDVLPERSQAWVIAVNSADGRFSTAVDAIRLDSACDPTLRP